MIPYGKHYITDEDIKAVRSALESDYITQGSRVEAFEQAFAEFTGSRFAVAVANGTAALHLSALALGVGNNTNVIVPAITFCASANCIEYAGGNVYFCDVPADNPVINADCVENVIASYPSQTFSGIVAVDFAGYPVHLEQLRKLADHYGMWILEDACHAPGAAFTDSRNVKQFCGNGTYADLATFSFHPVKHIACGEGGMVTTNNEHLYERIKRLRSHGITKNPDWLHEHHGAWYYEMQSLGYNYRLSDIHAALGLSQLQRIDENLERRHEIAERYRNALKDLPVEFVDSSDRKEHAYHLFVIRASARDQLFEYLRAKNIMVQVHYIPLHLQPYYSKQGWEKGDFPGAENYYKQCLSIPMYHGLTQEDQNYVIACIRTFFKHE